MSIDSINIEAEAAILGRLIDPSTPSLSPEAARAILQLDFQPRDQQRMQELAARAEGGCVSLEERAELESYNNVGHMLALLQSKARLSLKKPGIEPS